MIPWQLFQLTDRDRSGLLLRDGKISLANFGSSVSLQTTYTIPADYMYILFGFGCQATGGAGQFPNTTGIESWAPGAGVAEWTQYQDFLNPTAGVVAKTQMVTCYALIGPSHRLIQRTSFTGGAVSNIVTHSLQGMLVSKGTIGYS